VFIGRVISGITSASISTPLYIADVTPPERRAAVFGKIGAASAPVHLGPAIGGLLAAWIHACRSGSRQVELCEYALRLADSA